MAVHDADDIAHELMRPGTAAFGEIVRAFGADVLALDGALDRQKLGSRVFADPEKRARLNALVHPGVQETLRERLGRCAKDNRAACAIVPLLYECGMADGWDAVICVACREDVQVDRLKQRGLSEQEARLRMAAQMPLRDKIRRADYVIVNNGTKEMLREQTLRVLDSILEK